MKPKLPVFSLAIALLALAAVVWVLTVYYWPRDLGGSVVSVIVKPGDSFRSVARELQAKGVMSSPRILTLVARVKGIDKRLIPGRYDFTGAISFADVLEKFSRGDILKVKVTVPEGTPIWKVASMMAQRLGVDSAAIVRANTDAALLRRLQLPCLEGYLFPETYVFPWGIAETSVVDQMVSQFRAMTDSLQSGPIVQTLSFDDVIRLASIIEAETRLDHERPIVASVYLNRLRRNMKLDADPTVIYGLGGLRRPLTRRDLRIDTPYNTYLRKGLPPTPINSPGLASIRAVLRPAETDYLYFVANRTGGHYFSRSNAEQNLTRHRLRELWETPQ
ncbi:MAG TPA: endolytic transglycosylase MltG [Candidatus Deferrimicrobium sp.]|nr:endolytic transglycosylase MltG [Candidatus Deferrimicrobium sp.]